MIDSASINHPSRKNFYQPISFACIRTTSLPLSALLIVNSTVHAATDRVTLDIYIFLGAFWPRKRKMIRNRRVKNTTNNKQPEVLPGCFLESWVIDYPLTEKPEDSLKMFHSQDYQRSLAVVPQYESCSRNYRDCME